MDFILDTGSSWTWIPDQDCPADQCKRRHYEYSKSQGFRSHQEIKEVYYGIGYIRGEIVNDDIAVDASGHTFAREVNFLSVKQAQQLDALEADGLIGLGPISDEWGETKVHLLIN